MWCSDLKMVRSESSVSYGIVFGFVQLDKNLDVTQIVNRRIMNSELDGSLLTLEIVN